jgi:hypothetical protein
MDKLAQTILDAHGGLARWKKFTRIRAGINQGGALWILKGHTSALDDTSVVVATNEIWASQAPLGNLANHSVLTNDTICLIDSYGCPIEEVRFPQELFVGDTLETPWSALKLAYFSGLHIWICLNIPFLLAWNGVECNDGGEWLESGERWHRVIVHYPPLIAAFSKEMVLYVGSDGLIRRIDYDLAMTGHTPAAHYVTEYVTVSGVHIPSGQRVLPRLPDGSSLMGPLIASIILKNVALI